MNGGRKKTDRFWRVQIGSFSSRVRAESYLGDAVKKGFEGFVTPPAVVNGNEVHRVQIGAFTVKSYAENYLKCAKAAGFETLLVEV